jgi:hypothetical protein
MAIVRCLDVTKDYKIINVFYSKDNPTICDNCGRIITNIVVLEDNEKNIYNVGTECVKTINYFMNMLQGIRELKQAEKRLKDISKFHNWIKKSCKSHSIDDDIYSLYDDKNNCIYKVNKQYLIDSNLLNYIKK